MGFCLYIGTDVPVPTVTRSGSATGFHTRDLQDHEWPVSMRLTKPYRKYAGADIGRGFRREGAPASGEMQDNHLALHTLLEEILAVPPAEVELYACREGDLMRPLAGQVLMPLGKLLDPDFEFRERYHYIILKG